MFKLVASRPLINHIHRTRAKVLRSASLAETLERRVVLSAAPSFAPPILDTVGAGPTWVEAADFNGDGKTDMAISNTGGGTVSIRIGDGTGHFTSRPDLPVTVGVGNMVARDFNGDEILDLAVTKPAEDKLSIWLGDGTGHFAAHADFAVGPLPLNIAAGDFNGDGDLDLAVGNTNSFAPGGDSLSVMLGDGSGNFGNRTDVTTGAYPIDSVAADLNGDGNLDLIVAHANGDSVGVMLGDGTGQFGPRVDFSVGIQPFDVVAVDFDLDGKLDVATANIVGNTVSVLLGDGTGGLGPQTEFATGVGPPRLAAGDFNGDGNPDLVTPNYDDDTVTLLSGDGSGDFPDRLDLPVGNGPYHVAVADFNGDGKDDLAVLNNVAENVSILLNGLVSNSAPVANNDSFSGPENLQLTGNVLSNDTDAQGDALTAALVSGPAHGALEINADGSFIYTPAEDFVGVDTFTYTSSDGQAASDAATVTIDVTSVPAGVSSGLPDPGGPGTVTRVIGTSDDDLILLYPSGIAGASRITLNGTPFGPFSDDRIIIRAKGGDDYVLVVGSVSVSVYGGAGDDRLLGGAGHDMLQGGTGSDLMLGAGGRDLLIAGRGRDVMLGNGEDDILIAGYSRHDADPAALRQIMQEWTDFGTSYENRVLHLRGSLPGGRNGAIFLNGTSVFDDVDVDVLSGGAGMDWCIFDETRDRVTDLSSGELAE